MRREITGGRQPTNIKNVAKFILRSPRSLPTLGRKFLDRIVHRRRNAPSAANSRWIASNSIDAADLCKTLGPELWEETLSVAALIEKHGRPIVNSLDFDIGGGGDFRFLYWLVRYRKPLVVIETGVAAGWTTHAILAAMERNGRGHLYSSDFPYFRVDRPETYIGCVVPESLRHRWDLHLTGDDDALPKILADVEQVDLFHYDSDKSWNGRKRAVQRVSLKMTSDGLILIDDILDNSWFRDHAKRAGSSFSVINGRVGVIGELPVKQ